MRYQDFPHSIFSGNWPYGHCQGIAVDKQRQLLYCSFTTALIKLDFQGNVIGTVTGLLGHLGCIAFCEKDGRVYGSLEYKNDSIGQGILRRAGVASEVQTAFYIAVFDVDRMTRMDMDACADGIMTTVHLKEVYDDYTATVTNDSRQVEHRYGCSGIDGVTFGRLKGEEERLYVAYGVYRDDARTDNDYQVLLCYNTSDWGRYAQPLSQENMHLQGPERPERKLFVHTGNTHYGVQNLEYDEHTGYFLMAVYPGRKPNYPNYDLYAVDGSRLPEQQSLQGVEPPMAAPVLTLASNGTSEETPGWRFPYGSTGLCSLGDGYFYISEEGRQDKLHNSCIRLYRWDGVTPFVPVDEMER